MCVPAFSFSTQLMLLSSPSPCLDPEVVGCMPYTCFGTRLNFCPSDISQNGTQPETAAAEGKAGDLERYWQNHQYTHVLVLRLSLIGERSSVIIQSMFVKVLQSVVLNTPSFLHCNVLDKESKKVLQLALFNAYRQLFCSYSNLLPFFFSHMNTS